jgi:hypothetical protein
MWEGQGIKREERENACKIKFIQRWRVIKRKYNFNSDFQYLWQGVAVMTRLRVLESEAYLEDRRPGSLTSFPRSTWE